MTRIKSIEILFFAKLIAFIMGIAGLVCGVLYSFGGLFFEILSNNLNTGTALAFLALFGMPLLFAFTGFIAGAIGAVLYNLVARLTGGIQSGFKLDE
ncbi:MAG: hypothetical protein OXU24_06570 [Gammaproteobacteria bacterium]|nr:hypothetical protein [Gammaproteobacteria bacterium]